MNFWSFVDVYSGWMFVYEQIDMMSQSRNVPEVFSPD